MTSNLIQWTKNENASGAQPLRSKSERWTVSLLVHKLTELPWRKYWIQRTDFTVISRANWGPWPSTDYSKLSWRAQLLILWNIAFPWSKTWVNYIQKCCHAWQHWHTSGNWGENPDTEFLKSMHTFGRAIQACVYYIFGSLDTLASFFIVFITTLTSTAWPPFKQLSVNLPSAIMLYHSRFLF